jgi:hypothetical protein
MAEIISAFEQNGSRIQRLRNPERIDVDEALLTWLKQDRSDNIVPASDPLLMITFDVPKFLILNSCIFSVKCTDIHDYKTASLIFLYVHCNLNTK